MPLALVSLMFRYRHASPREAAPIFKTWWWEVGFAGGIAYVIYVGLLYSVDGWDFLPHLNRRLQDRTFSGDRGGYAGFFTKGLLTNLGPIAYYAFAPLTVLLLWLRKTEPLDGKHRRHYQWFFLTASACVFHVFLLRKHSAEHDFSGLKFAIVFTLLGVACLIALWDRTASYFNFIGATGLLLVLVQFGRNHYPFTTAHEMARVEWVERVGTSIRENTRFDQTVFSPDIKIQGCCGPEAMSYSLKRVQQYKGPGQMDAYESTFPQAHAVVAYLVKLHEPLCEEPRRIEGGLALCTSDQIRKANPPKRIAGQKVI